MVRRRFFVVGVGLVVAFASAVLGGAAVTGQAATTQDVVASLTCQPGTVKPEPGKTIGCVLTVTNQGGNTLSKVVATVTATVGTDPAGMFVSSASSPPCSGVGTAMLTCDIGKMAAGAMFSETHELQPPSSGASLTQTATGTVSTKPNSRSSDTIAPSVVITSLNATDDFDGRFADAVTESVQTAGGVSADNPYTTGATLTSTGAFKAGLTVHEQSAGENNPNCPNGCFGGQVVQFEITPLAGSAFPAGFTLVTTISGSEIRRGTKPDQIVVTHTFIVGNTPQTEPVPFCTQGTDPAGACVWSITIDPPTNNATIEVRGPGSGNGGWGFG